MTARHTEGALARLAAIALLLGGLLTLLGLAGCGTPYATVPDSLSRPVMLLGHDPVAYFTQGAPVRGRADQVVNLPQRSYYFASAENMKAFTATPEKPAIINPTYKLLTD